MNYEVVLRVRLIFGHIDVAHASSHTHTHSRFQRERDAPLHAVVDNAY